MIDFKSKIQNLKSKIPKHLPLAVILILFTAITLYNSAILPIGEADDETDHYQYLRFVARTWHPPFTEAERQEAGFKGGLAPLYYWLTAWPIAFIGDDVQPDIRRVDARPERHIPTDGLGINHVLHTLDEQWPWSGHPLAWHIIRLFSLPMGWVTIIATYALTRRLTSESKIIPLTAAAFVAFLPRFVISSAVINDDNLVFALTALLLLVQVIILQSNHPPSTKIMAVFGALFGLSLITKYFSLILIPEIVLTLFVVSRKVPKRKIAGASAPRIMQQHALRTTPYTPRSASQQIVASLLTFFLMLFITAGPWFTFIILRFNRIEELGFIPGLAASLGEPQITEGLVGLFSGQSVRPVAATYSLSQWFSLLYRSFWFEYGWMRIFAPTWIYTLFTIFILTTIIGLIYKIRTTFITHPCPEQSRRDASRLTLPSSPITWFLTLHLSLFAIVLIARYILSATIDTGQGRHLYPALPVIALLSAQGLYHFKLWAMSIRKIKSLEHQKWLPTATSVVSYLLPITCYLLPAVLSLLPPFTIYPLPNQFPSFILHHSSFILPHYPPLPIKAIPILLLPEQRQSIEFDNKLWLVGLETNNIVSAGDSLPVTLYWYAEQEAQQDYLISLCLRDDEDRPAACWRGHIVDGQYPARAWESGDTIVDTIFIPTPTCYRLKEQTYTLNLQIWPLDPTSPIPTLVDPPLLQHTFTKPHITIKATDSLRDLPPLGDLPQTVDMWQANQRLVKDTDMGLGQSLAHITYASHNNSPTPAFETATNPAQVWQPLTQLDTPLYLPCTDGPTPFAHLSHFIVAPTLSNGTYRPKSNIALPNLNFSFRDRVFAPITSTVSFSNTLSPLSLHLPNYPVVNLTQPSQPQIFNLQLPIPNIPLTIRWQTQRQMADSLVISLKLLDKDFTVGGERVAKLGDRYPNVLWAPTEIIEETYPLRLNPNTPPGLYQLELSLLHQDETLPDGFEYLPLINNDTSSGDNLYPVTIRLLDLAHNTPPSHPFFAQLAQTIHLIGYDLNQKSPTFNPSASLKTSLQSPISVALYWQSTTKIPDDYTVFTQLIGPDGQVWGQWDNPPQAGRYPTTAWAETDTVVDRYTLSLREGAPAGNYRLLVGMYNSTTGTRLPVTINSQPQPNNAIELTVLEFVP